MCRVVARCHGAAVGGADGHNRVNRAGVAQAHHKDRWRAFGHGRGVGNRDHRRVVGADGVLYGRCAQGRTTRGAQADAEGLGRLGCRVVYRGGTHLHRCHARWNRDDAVGWYGREGRTTVYGVGLGTQVGCNCRVRAAASGRQGHGHWAG